MSSRKPGPRQQESRIVTFEAIWRRSVIAKWCVQSHGARAWPNPSVSYPWRWETSLAVTGPSPCNAAGRDIWKIWYQQLPRRNSEAARALIEFICSSTRCNSSCEPLCSA
jgi:hypothetical protein